MSSLPGRDVPTRITDPKAVAALAHPLRMRLLGELARRGNARAVDLAEVVGEPPNSVSFHLRQLARYGLIEVNPDHSGDRRERWWRQTSDRGFQIDLEALAVQEGGGAAVDILRRVAEGHVVALHRAVRSQRGEGPSQSGEAAAGSQQAVSRDFAVRLDQQEFAEMRGELESVLEKWSERSRVGAAEKDGHQGRRGYYGVLLAAPEDDMFRVYADLEDQQP